MPDYAVLGELNPDVARVRDCPEVDRHTIKPGVVKLDVWFARMARTHTCERCPACGFWAIYVPKAHTPHDQATGTSDA